MIFFMRILLFLIAFCAVGAIICSRHRWRMPAPKYGDLQFNWTMMTAVWRTVDAVRYFKVVELIRDSKIDDHITAVEIEDSGTTDRYVVEIPDDIDVDAIRDFYVNKSPLPY
jgi:hypothetical protein